MPANRVVGIDAGGTKLLGGVVDEGLLVHHRVHRRWRGTTRQEVLEVLVGAVEEAVATAPEARVAGFGIPALMDLERAVVRECVHLPLAGIAFRDLMRERLDLPVVVDNDANCALLAETRGGAARGARGAVMLTLGTGIGGAILIDGAIYRGAHGSGGELGHMVVEAEGPECPCGNRGCLEMFASGTAIARGGIAAADAEPDSALAAAVAGGSTVTGALVAELAADGDGAATGVLAAAGLKLGAALSGLANAFNPDVIVIGGGAAAAGELLLAPAREEMARRALAPNRAVPVVPAHFGPEAGMLGAACLALEER